MIDTMYDKIGIYLALRESHLIWQVKTDLETQLVLLATKPHSQTAACLEVEE